MPATPSAAQILSMPVLFGGRAGKPSDQDGKQRKLDDAAVADSEIKSQGKMSPRRKGPKRLRTRQESAFSSSVNAESLDADRSGPREEDDAASAIHQRIERPRRSAAPPQTVVVWPPIIVLTWYLCMYKELDARADTEVLRLLQCALTPTVQIRTHLSVAEKAEWSIDTSNQMKSVQFK